MRNASTSLAIQLRKLSSAQLTARLKNLVAEERRINIEVLRHLREVERRLLHAEAGYKNLLAYCVGELKYSESAAYRRIQAMRLLCEIPEVEEKIQSGSLNLTMVTRVTTFFRQSQEQNKKTP